MEIKGYYRWCWAGGQEPLYTWSPHYGIRREYLPLVKEEMWQIRVPFLGMMVWVNVDLADVVTVEQYKLLVQPV
jgi:hypothetical protein